MAVRVLHVDSTMLEQDDALAIVRLLWWLSAQNYFTSQVLKADEVELAADRPGYVETLIRRGWLRRRRDGKGLALTGLLATCAGASRKARAATSRVKRQRLLRSQEGKAEDSGLNEDVTVAGCVTDGSNGSPSHSPSVVSLPEPEPESKPEQEQVKPVTELRQQDLIGSESDESNEIFCDFQKFKVPSWMPLKVWDEYVRMRVKMRRPLTDYAKELALKKLDDMRTHGGDVTAVLEQSILNGWMGIFEEREARSARVPAQGRADYSKVNYDGENINAQKIPWLDGADDNPV